MPWRCSAWRCSPPAWTSRLVSAAGGLFTLGILLFSGSLYLLTLSGVGKLGIVTPFGGVSFLAGWLCLGLAAWRLGNA